MYGIYIRVALQIQKTVFASVLLYAKRPNLWAEPLRCNRGFLQVLFELIKSLQVMPYEVAGEQLF
jgi:hypothetical protein